MRVLPNIRQQLQRSVVVANFEAAYKNLLNAQAETDRLCANNSVQSILNNCDREKILRAISTACSLYEYYARLSARLLLQQSAGRV